MIMKTYELVCVIDAWLPNTEITATKERVVSQLTKAWWEVIATDDIGLLPTAYPIRGQDQAYYLSLHIRVDANQLPELREVYGLEKGLARVAFYSMGNNQEFFSYAQLAKRYEDILDLQEETEEEVEETTKD